MVRKFIASGIAVTLLSACAVDSEDFKVATKNGKDYYKLDINGMSQGSYDTQLKHWGNQFCPQGYEVVDSKFTGYQQSVISPVTNAWYEVTIACPAR